MRFRDLEHRLLARSVLIPEGEPHAGCWMWMGRVEKNGYAKLGFWPGGGRGASVVNVWVHRVALEVYLGRPIKDNHDADHICQFRLCIHPNHLRERLAAKNRSAGAKKGNKMRYASNAAYA
jgi:hypothetical protein